MSIFTNKEMLEIAMKQSSIDSNCGEEDFLKKENVVVISKENPLARKYLRLPHVCDLTTYGTNIVASIDEKYRNVVEGYIGKYSLEHCFETPNIHVLHEALKPY